MKLNTLAWKQPVAEGYFMLVGKSKGVKGSSMMGACEPNDREQKTLIAKMGNNIDMIFLLLIFLNLLTYLLSSIPKNVFQE